MTGKELVSYLEHSKFWEGHNIDKEEITKTHQGLRAFANENHELLSPLDCTPEVVRFVLKMFLLTEIFMTADELDEKEETTNGIN